jgi:hypothetical protein
VNDPDARYWCYFTSVPSGSYGTTNAVLVEDADGVIISGSVGGHSTISHSFAFDRNSQGGRTSGSDAPITAVAIGLETSQFVKATTTIVRATSNPISLVSALERNFSNP